MYRGSALIGQLVRDAADLGVLVSKYQIEIWSQHGLLPPVGTPQPRLLDHVIEVRKTHRAGPGANERTTLVLAARGFGCSGLPGAVARAWGASDPEHLQVLAAEAVAGVPDPDTDEGSWDIEQQVQLLLGGPSPHGLPTRLLELFSAVAGAITREAEQRPVEDDATGQLHSPSNTVVDVLNDTLAAGYGRSPLDPEATRILGNGLVGEARKLTSRGQAMIEAATPQITTAPLAVLANFSTLAVDDLVGGAQVLWAILSQISALRSAHSPEQRDRIEYLAGAFSPLGIAVRSLLRAASADHPDPSL